MNHQRAASLSFWCGFVVAVASYSLYQDLLGRDRYIESVRTSWVSGWWSIPLDLVLLLGAFVVREVIRREAH